MSSAVSPTTYDIVVLGAGSGGYACALRAAQLGLTVALVERSLLGGTCLHRGCIPTKALLHSAEVADAARTADRFGVRAELLGVDMPAVNRYKDGVVRRLHHGLRGLVGASGVDYIAGQGRLVDASSVEVDGRTVRGRHVVLATGSAPRHLPGVNLKDPVVSSEGAVLLDRVPTHAVILGGGVIGVEFASIYRSFGAEVTIVEALDRLVAAEDTAVSAALARAFGARGIDVRTEVRVVGVHEKDGVATVELSDGDRLEGDLVLVALGRDPLTAGLGYAEAGVETDHGFVVTDDRLRTSLDGVFAVGDLVSGPALAHRGFAHGIFVAEEVAGLAPVPVRDQGIPRITYCAPEIVSVGFTEEQARQTYEAADVRELSLAGNGKSQILGTSGFVKVVRSHRDGPVVGVHMIGARLAEQSGEAQLIVNWEALPDEVAALVHAHPTQNEALGEAHLALAGKPLHSHT
ncbi:MAG TPA: dihydrolipoyl dehydrogenase [Ornithinimicrobium sp.]|uniref:dihydrolipoyl dehydrogenase n=1 Tax=Ornithinimicrobium sp. TaxID=1977084 RepID=UPI002B46C698|nr:dihydrolipoyl dehydrogenase [Ornithinimicrobium sp.]HKJ11919.1 dihydrolipoyl dehydrogenase [Ornithinimicrobium sp.]